MSLPSGIQFDEPCLLKSSSTGKYGLFIPKKFVRSDRDRLTVQGSWVLSERSAKVPKADLENVQRKFPSTSKSQYGNDDEYVLAKAAYNEAVRKDFEREIQGEEEDSDDTATPETNKKRKVAELFSSSEDEGMESEDEDEDEDDEESDEEVETIEKIPEDDSSSSDDDSSSGSSSSGDSDKDSSSGDSDSVQFLAQTSVTENIVEESLLSKETLSPYHFGKYVHPVLEVVRDHGGHPETLFDKWRIRIRTRNSSDGSSTTDVQYLDSQGHVSKSRPEIIRSLGLIKREEAHHEAALAVKKFMVEVAEGETGSTTHDSEDESSDSSSDSGSTKKKKRRKNQSADEPTLKMELIQGAGRELVISRIGRIIPDEDYCCMDHGMHVFYPCGFQSRRLFLGPGGETETYLNEILPGPEFVVKREDGQILFSGDSPLEVWRQLIDHLFNNFFRASRSMEVGIAMSELRRNKAKARRADMAKRKNNSPSQEPNGHTAKPKEYENLLVNFHIPEGEELEVDFFSGEENTVPYYVVSGFNGNIGTPSVHIGDRVIAAGADGDSLVKPESASALAKIVKSAQVSVQLFVRRAKLDVGRDELNLSVLKRARNDLSDSNGDNAFQFACCIFGLVEASNRVRLLSEAMPSSLKLPDYKFYYQYPRTARATMSRTISKFDAVLNACLKTIPKGLRNLERKCGISSKVHMRAEDIRSAKHRTVMRKSDQMAHWNSSIHTLVPPFFSKPVEDLNLHEQKKKKIIVRLFQLPCVSLHKQLTGKEGFDLEQLYDWQFRVEENRPPKTDKEKVAEVLDFAIGRIEVSSWKVAHQGALRRGVEKFGPQITELLASNTEDGSTLRDYGYTCYSLLARCMSLHIKASGLSWRRGGKTLQEKQSLEQQAVGILSKRASRIVRGVLNRLVNKVVKGYKIWKVQQRRLRMAAARRNKKENKFPDSVDYTPAEYATICLGVQTHGKDWREILNDPVFLKGLRPHHQTPRSLARAWSDLRSVVSVRGRKDRLYPLMGFYIRLSIKATKRRGEDDGEFCIAHTKPRKGKHMHDPDNEYIFIGRGCDDLTSSKLALSVSIKRKRGSDKEWVLGPVRDGHNHWMYCKDDVIYHYSATAEEWIKDSKTKVLIIKSPEDEEEDEEDTEVLAEVQVIQRIKHCIKKRKLLENRQRRLERRLQDAAAVLKDCDRDYLMTVPKKFKLGSPRGSPRTSPMGSPRGSSRNMNGSPARKKKRRDSKKLTGSPMPHFANDQEAEHLVEDLDNILETF